MTTIINLSKLKKIATTATAVDLSSTDRLNFNNSIYATEFHGKFQGNGDGLTFTESSNIKTYINSKLEGLDPKQSVKAATNLNKTLTGLDDVDGVGIVAGDRVLVKSQANPAENGIYIAANGAWTRSVDMNDWNEVPSAYVFVEQGNTHADTGWVCKSNKGGTLGRDEIPWVQFTGAGTVKGTKDNISVTNNTVDLVPVLTSITDPITVNSATTINALTIDKYGRVTGTGDAITIKPDWSSIASKPASLVYDSEANTFTKKQTFAPSDSVIAPINIPSRSTVTPVDVGDFWLSKSYGRSYFFFRGSAGTIPNITENTYIIPSILDSTANGNSGFLKWNSGDCTIDTTAYAPLKDPAFTGSVSIGSSSTAATTLMVYSPDIELGLSADADSKVIIGCGKTTEASGNDRKLISIGNNGLSGSNTEIFIGHSVGSSGSSSATLKSTNVTTNIGTDTSDHALSTINIGTWVHSTATSGDDTGRYIINIGYANQSTTKISGVINLLDLNTVPSATGGYDVLTTTTSSNTITKLTNIALVNNWRVAYFSPSRISANARDRILVSTLNNTSGLASSTRIIDLNNNPLVGDDVYIVDLHGNFGTYPITISAATDDKIMGSDQDLVLDVDNQGVILVYSGTARGWVVL